MILFNVKQGEYNSDNFVTFLESLFHKLSIMKISNGKLIMDNVRFHKTKSVRLLIENKGYGVMFLPPYSPFLNPIKNMFSKWKDLVRRKIENEDDLMIAINETSMVITSEDCNK